MKTATALVCLLLIGGPAFAQGELFRLPLTSNTTGHYYFDHDTGSGCKDWQCDTSCDGSNNAYGGHTGTDFSGGGLDVHAAATGWIIDVRNDRPPCTVCPDPPIYDNFPQECQPVEGNWVQLQHSGGTRTSYLHMEKGTVIGKQLYDRVECGEILGKSGSSGAACGAHLHFGLRVNGERQDPFKGTCNNISKSWWVNQGTGSPGTACAASPFKFANGNCIRTTAAVNVRDAAAGGFIREQPAGSLGTIIGGPEGEPFSGGFYVWWRIRWSDGQEGWSVEDQLEKGQCGVAPSPPANLAQVSCNGSVLPAGGSTNTDTLRLRGTVSGSAGSQLRLEIELRPRTTAFTGEPTHTSDPVSSGSTAVVKSVTSLANDDYHWRARTVEGTLASNWASFGNNADSAADFTVAASSCILCTFGEGARVFAGACSNPLSVSLSASPSSGTAPMADVDLTASVSGTATGTINYTFYCNRPDLGTDITPGWNAKFDGVTSNPKTAADVCDYSAAGTYTAKVIAERGAYAAEKRTTITVGQPSPGGAPVVTTLAATSITQSSASLNMTVNPGGSATSVWFNWGTSTSVSQSLSSQGVGAGAVSIPASITLSGLSCGTTYYFRARAQNGLGSASPGAVLSFPTAACGCGTSQSTELIRNGDFQDDGDFWTLKNDFHADGFAYLSKSDGSAGDGLNGEIYQNVTIPANATSATLTFWTRISTSEPAGGAAQDFLNATLQRTTGTFLSSLAIYSNQDASGSYVKRTFNLVNFIGQTFRIHFLGVTNVDAQPTLFRIDDVSLSVTVPAGSEPNVTTDAADQITDSSVRLNMTVDPNDDATTAWFDLEIDDSSPNTDTEHIAVGCGSQSRSASISVYGLQCDSTYYFEANAQNAHGSDDGTTRQFKTAACAGGGDGPGADTDPAVNIASNSATLTADVDANGLSTQAWFAWGTTAGNLNQETPHQPVGSEPGSVDFSYDLSGLACGTTYYFQNRASNSAGQDSGSTLSFETLACEGAGPATEGFFLEHRRQGCSGAGPAVLLWWTAPSGASGTFTVRRTDGVYSATVNSSQQGMVHLVTSLLVPGETYGFYVEGTLNGSPIQTNAVTMPVISDECRLPVGASDAPHLPLVWAGIPFCSGSTASVPIHWTPVGGAASYTLTRFDNAAALSTPYPNLTGTSAVDSGLLPGGEYQYHLEAFGSAGSRVANQFGVFIPSDICGEPSAPGPFSAQVSAPVCNAGQGSVTLSWTSSSGAKPMRTFWADDGFTHGSGTTFVGTSKQINGIRPGALVKLMVQAESSATPGRYRSLMFAQRIPVDICGAGTLPPSVSALPAAYVQEQQALLRASVIPNASSSFVYLDWGTSTSYGLTTPTRSSGEGYRSVNLGETVTGLTCGTTYHFRGRATNPVGETTGPSSSFTTLPCCYPLSRSLNDPSGGGIPAASPLQSPGCPAGQYSPGQTIQVSASPASGWQVGNWAGTQNDGSTATTNTVLMPATPHSVQVNYVHPIDSSTSLDFYTLIPCRLIDTRQTATPLRSEPGPLRTVQVSGVCGVPASARAVSINTTVVAATAGGFVTLFPADQLQPGTSSINFGVGQTRANNAVLPISTGGLLGVVATLTGTGQVDLVVDVNGYFAPSP